MDHVYAFYYTVFLNILVYQLYVMILTDAKGYRPTLANLLGK